MFHSLSGDVSALACVLIPMTYIVTGIAIAPNQARHKTDSNKRAKLCACPPSSASTATNSPPTDQGVWIAVKSGYAGGTPGPKPTPHPEDSGKHTVRAQKQYWRQHKHVRSAANRRRKVIHLPQTTPSRDHRVVGIAHCVRCTGRVTAGQGGSYQDQSGS